MMAYSSAADTQHLLASVLEDPYFLSRVLQYIAPDGVHECQRVCQKWKAVCGLLSLSLDLKSIDDISRAVHRFPRAESVTLRLERPGGKSYRWLESSPRQTRLSDDLMTSFALMPNLRKLDVPCAIDAPRLLGRLRRLESLCVQIGAEQEEQGRLFEAMQWLTNLTSLKLLSPAASPERFASAPLRELRKLQDLEAPPNLLLLANRNLTFPSAALTRLVISTNAPRSHALDVKFEKLTAYAPSLLSFGVDLPGTVGEGAQWTALQKLNNLESVALSFDHNDPSHYAATLTKLQNLTQLELHRLRRATLTALAPLFSLRRLDSLELTGAHWWNGSADSVLPPFSGFSQLTKLRAHLNGCAISLAGLTALVELDVSLNGDSAKSIVQSLPAMTRLRALRLKSTDSRTISVAGALKRLPKLRSLRMSLSYFDPDVLPAVAGLQALTALHFSCHVMAGATLECLSPVNALTGLRHLTLDIRRNYVGFPVVPVSPLSLTGVLDGQRLAGLRVLDLAESVELVRNGGREEMMQKFPSLRAVLPYASDVARRA